MMIGDEFSNGAQSVNEVVQSGAILIEDPISSQVCSHCIVAKAVKGKK